MIVLRTHSASLVVFQIILHAYVLKAGQGMEKQNVLVGLREQSYMYVLLLFILLIQYLQELHTSQGAGYRY